jgi:hypothetical protein
MTVSIILSYPDLLMRLKDVFITHLKNNWMCYN